MDVTLGAALLAGIISFLSPCVLPVVPAYLGQLGVVVARSATSPMAFAGSSPVLATETSGGGAPTSTMLASGWAPRPRFGAMPNAVAFVLGFGIVFTLLGLTLSAALAPLRDYLPLLQRIGGILLIILGLNLMGVLRLQRLAGSWRPLDRLVSFRPTGPRRGVWGGLVLGIVFAVGWTPCIGPTLGAILTMAAIGAPAQAVLLLIAYSLGLGIPFLLLALAADRSPAITRPLIRHGHTIEVIGGALVVVMGLAILFDWLGWFSTAFVAFWPQV